jgi:hypothetical protein
MLVCITSVLILSSCYETAYNRPYIISDLSTEEENEESNLGR